MTRICPKCKLSVEGKCKPCRILYIRERRRKLLEKALKAGVCKCTRCKQEKEVAEFLSRNRTRRYSGLNEQHEPTLMDQCLTCRRESRAHEARRIYYRTRAQAVWDQSYRQDNDRKFENDLTVKFIEQQLAQSCSYCGETQLKMTLDRIDNDLGHTQANVLPACLRCNLFRKDLPFPVWEKLCEGMRTAREAGLFGQWMPAPFTKRYEEALKTTTPDN